MSDGYSQFLAQQRREEAARERERAVVEEQIARRRAIEERERQAQAALDRQGFDTWMASLRSLLSLLKASGAKPQRYTFSAIFRKKGRRARFGTRSTDRVRGWSISTHETIVDVHHVPSGIYDVDGDADEIVGPCGCHRVYLLTDESIVRFDSQAIRRPLQPGDIPGFAPNFDGSGVQTADLRHIPASAHRSANGGLDQFNTAGFMVKPGLDYKYPHVVRLPVWYHGPTDTSRFILPQEIEKMCADYSIRWK